MYSSSFLGSRTYENLLDILDRKQYSPEKKLHWKIQELTSDGMLCHVMSVEATATRFIL